MKTKSLFLTAALAANVTFSASAQDAAAPAPAPAPEATEAQAPAALKLADIDPAVRAYLLETLACVLDESAGFIDKMLEQGKTVEDIEPSHVLPIVMEILEKNPTDALPPQVKGFMDEFIALAKKASDELMLVDAEDNAAAEAIFMKYEQPMMAIVSKYPEAVALGMQLAMSAEALGDELEAESLMNAVFVAMMASGEDPSKIKEVAPILRDAATKLRSKK